MSTGNADESLLTNLETTLRQSKDLFKQLEEQAKIIAKLKADNERLEKELTKKRTTVQGSCDAQNILSAEALLLKDIQSQREIDRLKIKLRTIKEKVRSCGLENMIMSSPLTPAHHFPTIVRPNVSAAKTHRSNAPVNSIEPTEDGSASRGPCSMNENSDAPTSGQSDVSRKKRKLSNVRNVAIAAVAEDGEEFSNALRHPSRLKSFPETRQSPSHRKLNDLLSFPPPGPTTLSMEPRNPAASTIRLGPTGNAHECLHETPVSTSGILSKTRQTIKPDPVSKDQTTRFSKGRFLRQSSMTKFSTSSTLRSKDNLDSISLSERQQPCSDECRDECCNSRRLRRQSSYLLLPARYRNMSDYDILCQYLGQGSDNKIQNLTASARENLLHEAKTKIIAEDVGRSNKDGLPRGRSPVGFWDTDWANSQEQEKGIADA